MWIRVGKRTFLSMILYLFIAAAKKGKPTVNLHFSYYCVSQVNSFLVSLDSNEAFEP